MTLATDNPALAELARERLQHAVAYLATVRADGSPRLHPVFPVITSDGVYVFMEPTSPKRHDLLRDPRYALHAGVEDNDGGNGELAATGTARPVTDPSLRATVASATTRERWVLFALEVQRVTAKRYAADGRPDTVTWPSAV